MTWYGGGASGFPLDKVELLSGPVLSDIEQGCVEPPAPLITVCPTGQVGCVLGSQMPWSVPPAYVFGDQIGTGQATGDTNCGWSPVGWTTPDENQNWKSQSIVQVGGSFNYPKTGMSAWLCANVDQGQSCNGGTNPQYCMNNSSAEGQLFYQQVALMPPPNFAVYAVQNCDGSEGVNGSNTIVPGYPGLSNPHGFAAISYDMSSPSSPSGQCKKNPTR